MSCNKDEGESYRNSAPMRGLPYSTVYLSKATISETVSLFGNLAVQILEDAVKRLTESIKN